jgi:dihydrolipoamide dehydrogenase
MARSEYDLVVIGAGPGGYCAAIRAAQLGMKTACIEKESAPGGTCLRVGCIPSKALLESSEIYWAAKNALGAHGVAVQGVELDLATLLGRKDKIVRGLTGGVRQLLKKNKVEHIRGNAQLADQRTVKVESDDGPLTLRARHLVLATGSLPASLSGVEPDGKLVVTSTEALSFEKVPEHLVVVGAGYIGLELGSVWRRLGAQVTVLEYLDRILPGMDKEIADEALKIFGKQGLEFRLGSKVTGAKSAKNRATVECEGEDPIECDRVLVAVGRRPNTNGLGLESLDVEIDGGGRVVVDEQFQTTVPGIYAIGDLIAGPMLAHKAMEEGVACADLIAGGYGRVNYDAIPGVVFTHPEIASVGKTEEELKAESVAYRKGKFPFAANGRARSLGQTEGWVKILADEKTDRILGVHIIGPRAGELIAEATLAMACGASSEDVGRTIHAHPTLAETLKEGALTVLGRALHH